MKLYIYISLVISNYIYFISSMESFECCICLEIPTIQNISKCKDCEHIYCTSCFNKIVGNKCPMCRSVCGKTTLTRFERGYFEETLTICTCGYKDIKVKDMNTHLLEICPLILHYCKWPMCRRMFVKTEIQSHESLCEYKLEVCDICATHVILATHICTKQLITCPNNECNIRMKREDQPYHNTHCVYRLIKCENGCDIPWKDGETHECPNPKICCDKCKHIHRISDDCITILTTEITALKRKRIDHGNTAVILKIVDNVGYIDGVCFKDVYVSRICMNITVYLKTNIPRIEFAFIPGEYDDTLEWPFKGKVWIDYGNAFHTFSGVTNIWKNFCAQNNPPSRFVFKAGIPDLYFGMRNGTLTITFNIKTKDPRLTVFRK